MKILELIDLMNKYYEQYGNLDIGLTTSDYASELHEDNFTHEEFTNKKTKIDYINLSA